MTCGAVVLAAGASRRLGTPKQLVAYEGRPLIVHAATQARDAGCAPVVVVTGCHADRVTTPLAALAWITTTTNEDWERGQGTSVAAGIRAMRAADADATAALLLACDQPLIPISHLRALVDLVRNGEAEIAATRHADGVGGVPACLAAVCFEELEQLDGETGARSLIRRGDRITRCLDTPGADLDVDRPEDLARVPGIRGI